MPVVLVLLDPLPELLDLQDQRLKPIGEELPGEDLALVEGGEELVQALQDRRPVHRDHVELAVQAPEQGLDRLVVDCPQVDGGTLGDLHYKDPIVVQQTRRCSTWGLMSSMLAMRWQNA